MDSWKEEEENAGKEHADRFLVSFKTLKSVYTIYLLFVCQSLVLKGIFW